MCFSASFYPTQRENHIRSEGDTFFLPLLREKSIKKRNKQIKLIPVGIYYPQKVTGRMSLLLCCLLPFYYSYYLTTYLGDDF